jgi:hypothetical protein
MYKQHVGRIANNSAFGEIYFLIATFASVVLNFRGLNELAETGVEGRLVLNLTLQVVVTLDAVFGVAAALACHLTHVVK